LVGSSSTGYADGFLQGSWLNSGIRKNTMTFSSSFSFVLLLIACASFSVFHNYIGFLKIFLFYFIYFIVINISIYNRCFPEIVWKKTNNA